MKEDILKVKMVQALLIVAGHDTTDDLDADGIFNDATKRALIDYQQANGLEETGVIDDATLADMENPRRYMYPLIKGEDEVEDEDYAPTSKKLQAALILEGYTDLIADGDEDSDEFLDALMEYATTTLIVNRYGYPHAEKEETPAEDTPVTPPEEEAPADDNAAEQTDEATT